MILTCYLYSCKHCDDRTCEQVPKAYKSLIPFSQNDTIKFGNTNGKEFTFLVEDISESQTSNIDCKMSSWGCFCNNCNAFYKMRSASDSLRNNINSYNMFIDYYVSAGTENDTLDMRLNINLFDFEDAFSLGVISNTVNNLNLNGTVLP